MKTKEPLAEITKSIINHPKYNRYEKLLSLFLFETEDNKNLYHIPQEEIIEKFGVTGKETLKGMFSALNNNLLKEFKREIYLVDYSAESVHVGIIVL